jgi:hypothetical protein
MYLLVLLCDSYRPPHQRRCQRSELTSRVAACAAAGDKATPTPNLRDGKCLNFQRKTDRQLKLSKLSTLKGLKLSKMSNHSKSLLLVDTCVKVVNALEERSLALFHKLHKYVFSVRGDHRCRPKMGA